MEPERIKTAFAGAGACIVQYDRNRGRRRAAEDGNGLNVPAGVYLARARAAARAGRGGFTMCDGLANPVAELSAVNPGAGDGTADRGVGNATPMPGTDHGPAGRGPGGATLPTGTDDGTAAQGSGDATPVPGSCRGTADQGWRMAGGANCPDDGTRRPAASGILDGSDRAALASGGAGAAGGLAGTE